MDKRSVLDRRCYVVGIFWLLLIALASVVLAAPAVLPKPSSLAYSVDTAGMITAEDAAKIAEMGRGLDAATGAQVVVVTIPSLDGVSIEEYATTLFRNWGIGNAEQNNGVLLLIAKEGPQVPHRGRLWPRGRHHRWLCGLRARRHESGLQE